MNMETILIGTICGLIYLPIVGAWAQKTFALSRELREAEQRLNKQIERIEERLNQGQTAMQQVARDCERAIGKLEGKLDMLLRDHEQADKK